MRSRGLEPTPLGVLASQAFASACQFRHDGELQELFTPIGRTPQATASTDGRTTDADVEELFGGRSAAFAYSAFNRSPPPLHGVGTDDASNEPTGDSTAITQLSGPTPHCHERGV